MILSLKHKFIFIHVQRTGGSSFINCLQSKVKGELEYHDMHANARTNGLELLEKYSDFHIFGFVRNPWERMVSWFAHVHRFEQKNLAEMKVEFEAFLLQDEALRNSKGTFHYNQLDYFTSTTGKRHAKRIYRYEKIYADIELAFADIGIPRPTIERTNSTISFNYRDFYSLETKKFIAEKCKSDIANFGYEF